MLTRAAIKDRAASLGFDACGVAPALAHPELAALAPWLAGGYAGSMAYLERTAAMRADARHVLPDARTVIVTATNYNTDRPYSTECTDRGRAQIARYAWGDDYHTVVGTRQATLLAWMHEVSNEPFQAASYVDTGPVQERVYARHAGIGWIGRNACVINERLGSWLFLGAIVTSLDLETDAPALDHCGSCTLCLEACPTQAFVAPAVLDARKCISYLTIEHRGDVSETLEPSVGSHVYGCDVCQEVCPWNAVAPVSADPAWAPRPVWDAPSLVDLERMSDAELHEALRNSAMKRAKLARLRQNIAVARGNAST
jgi:epoxyqueuosine reductase